MTKRIILLSGPVASGKTTVADALIKRCGFACIKTRHLIQVAKGAECSREQLQEAGEALDRETGGKWVGKALSAAASKLHENAEILVDAVRIEAQVETIRDLFGRHVTHVHLSAPAEILAERYRQRHGEEQELSSYDAVQSNETERRVGLLARIADIVIDTQHNTPEDVVMRLASHLGLYCCSVDRLVDVLNGE